MAISVQVGDIQSVINRLTAIPVGLEKYVIRNLAQVAQDNAESGADRHSKTGALRQSLYNRPVVDGRAVGHDRNRAPYAAFVLLGTRPHKITPKRKKALRWAAGGKFFFAKSVNHPGYRGDNYLLRAATEAVRQFDRIVREGMAKQ
tara:strand:+ start:420 stop:857 length:438 start_codon:yes stop_codon:yes gene_type:complete